MLNMHPRGNGKQVPELPEMEGNFGGLDIVVAQLHMVAE